MRPHLARLVEEFRKHAGETAVVAHRGNRRYPTSYGQLAEIAGRFAAELERRGIVAGDRVVLWGQNSAEWVGVFFGCLLRGVIAVPLDAAGTPDFAARIVRDVAPKLIVADPELIVLIQGTGNTEQRTERPKAARPCGAQPFLFPEPCSLPLPTILEHLPAAPLFTVSDAVHEDTPFQIVFTSGTTSEPRGIVHTHRNVLVTLQPIENEMAKYRRYERIFHPLRFLQTLPLSHVFGQFMALWCPALLAAEVHFAEQLEPARTTSLIRRERISVLIAVPRVLHLLRMHLLGRFPSLAAQIDQPERSNARGAGAILGRWWRFRRVHRALGWKFWAVISGGATLPAELEAFWNRLGYALIQGYGMTETSALVTLNHPFHIAPGTIGRPLPGREVRIAESGEILVRGDMVAGATWSGGAMHRRESEWLATGDLAEKDAAGDLRFLGRKGDVIVTGAGMNIHPADLEAALTAQPGVREAVVVPCDLAGGTEPVAVVLFAGGNSDAQLDDAVAAANRTLAEYQQIRRVLRWPEIEFPHTSTGKLLRRQVAQWACAAYAPVETGERDSAVRPLSENQLLATQNVLVPTQNVLLALISEITGEPTPNAADPNALRLSEDLHLDSLGRVQLQSALEQRFGLELEDDAVATVGGLRELAEGGMGSGAVKEAGAQLDSASAGGATERPGAQAAEPAAESNTYPRWPWRWPMAALRFAFLELVVRPLVWFLGAPRVRSQLPVSNEQPRTPCLIVCNHVAPNFDGALVLYALPFRLRRRVAIAMSGEKMLDFRHGRRMQNQFRNRLAPAAYWLITGLFNVFPLPKTRAVRRSFAHAGEAMDRGYSVLLFPEGIQTPDGTLQPFRAGIGLLAQESQVPILPVALAGLYELRAKHAGWFRSGRLEVRIGQPVPAPAAGSDPAELAAALEETVRSLLAQPD